MKKLGIFVILITSAICFSQTTDYTGMWQIVVKRSGGKNYSTPTEYVELKSDKTYLWGIDSTKTDPLDGASKGTWMVGEDSKLKLIPAVNPDNEASIFRKTDENKFVFESREINGKVQAPMMEMSLSLEKVK